MTCMPNSPGRVKKHRISQGRILAGCSIYMAIFPSCWFSHLPARRTPSGRIHLQDTARMSLHPSRLYQTVGTIPRTATLIFRSAYSHFHPWDTISVLLLPVQGITVFSRTGLYPSHEFIFARKIQRTLLSSVHRFCCSWCT